MEPLAADISRALGSPDAEERRQSLSEVGALPPAAAAPLLLRALGDDDWRVRKEATVAARGFGPAPELVAALVAALGERDDVGLRNAAVDVLGGLGDAATAALAEAAVALDADGRKLAVQALGKARDPAALGPLAVALGDDDDNVRQSAVEAIAGLGALGREQVQEILLGCLDDRDHVVRLGALEGLAALDVPIPWPRLGPLLADPTLRAAAIPAAALSDSPEAASAVCAVLAGARGSSFELALRALGRLGEGPLRDAVARAVVAAGPALGERLLAAAGPEGGSDAAARRATALLLAAAAGVPGVVDAAVAALDEELIAEPARQALAALGAPALPEIIARMEPPGAAGGEPPPPGVRAALVDVVAAILRAGAPPAAEDEALAALRRALAHPATERLVAVRALLALSRSGGPDDLTLVAELTLSEARALAVAAEGALASLSTRFPSAARDLVDCLVRDGSPRALLPAAIALGAAAATELAERDVAFLAHAATAGDPRARRAAVHAVAEIRALTQVAFPGATEVLRVALADEEHEVRIAAARALGRLCTARDPLSVSDVLDIVDRSGEADLVAATVRALGEGMGRRAPPDLVPALGLFARGAPSLVALAAVEALGQAQRAAAPSAASALAGALDHPDEAVVKAALLKLAAAAGAAGAEAPGAASALRRGLGHEQAAVRALAVELLVDVHPEEARPWLLQQLAAEPDRRVQEAIRRALGPSSEGSKSSPSLPTLPVEPGGGGA